MSILSIFKLLILPELSGIEKQSSALGNCHESVFDEDEKQISVLVERGAIYRGHMKVGSSIIFRELLSQTFAVALKATPFQRLDHLFSTVN